MVGTLVWGCRCATSWCNLDLTFDLDIVTMSFKSCLVVSKSADQSGRTGSVGIPLERDICVSHSDINIRTVSVEVYKLTGKCLPRSCDSM